MALDRVLERMLSSSFDILQVWVCGISTYYNVITSPLLGEQNLLLEVKMTLIFGEIELVALVLAAALLLQRPSQYL